MPRVPRRFLPEAGFFHVTARGVGPGPIVRDDEDRRVLLALLGQESARDELAFHVLCVMDTHYHLVVEGARDALSAAMHRVNGTHAQAFNKRHGRWGHLFGERFSSWVVLDEAHLAATMRYVLNNPVRAGLCPRAADWPWSRSRHGFSLD
jgi:putative transposase